MTYLGPAPSEHILAAGMSVVAILLIVWLAVRYWETDGE